MQTIQVNSKIVKANSKNFLKKKFPSLIGNKISTSRMWEKIYNKSYLDNWWFKLGYSDLEKYDYIIFAGALDYKNINFKIFKIPTQYFLDNIDKIDMTNKGWINLYISINDYIDLRNKNNLSFKQFILN